VIANLLKHLETGGAKAADVVKTTVYVAASHEVSPGSGSEPTWEGARTIPDVTNDSLRRPLIGFALLGLLVLVLVAASGIIVIRRLATEQALNEAQQLTDVSARVVERRVTDGLVTGDALALGAVTRVVQDAVLHDPVVRVKIWDRDGTIVYSDDLRLIGDTYALGADDLAVIDQGGVAAEVSDLSRPENRFERSYGELLEVYTQIRTPDGTPLLFETYQLSSSIADRRRELAATFAPVLVITLLALALLEIPLAWAFARRVRATQRERERLMQRAIESSDRERRRIAGDLHDGPVQELAGLSMQLVAAAERAKDPADGDVLRSSASAVRGSVRTLRAAVVGVYPPNLQQSGLAAALSDLAAHLRSEGMETELDTGGVSFGPEAEALIYRAAQEALRNVAEHADAQHVRITLRREGDRAVLEVIDDGHGIAPGAIERARAGDHMGIAILGDLIRDGGGVLTVRPGDPGGTVVRVETAAQ
jgi:two-component system, NarL family, sensor kinase